MLVVFLLLISGSIHQSLQINLTAKCCPEGFNAEEMGNFELSCRRADSRRLQVWSNSYFFIEKGIEGECIDFDGKNVTIYQMNISSISSKVPYSNEIFPKCCPLNYAYNNSLHSCSKTENIPHDFIKSQVVQVGLPHNCRTITDETFSSLKDANLWIEKRPPANYCLDMDVRGKYVTRECHEGIEVCMKKRCFKKCCPDGQSYVEGANCKDTYEYGLKLPSEQYSQYIQDIDGEFNLRIISQIY